MSMRALDTAAVRLDDSLVRVALVVAGVLVFFTGIDNYAFQFWGGPAPLRFIVVWVGAAAVLAVWEPHRPLGLLRSPLLAWLVFFFAMTALWAVWMRASTLVHEEFNARLRSIAFMAAFAIILDSPRARRAAVVLVAAGVVLAACINVGELTGLVTFMKQEELRVLGRPGGFYINPNDAGLAIVFGLAVVASRIGEPWRTLLLVIGTIGVLATFSRGAQVTLIVLVAMLAWRREAAAWPFVLAGLVGVIVLSQTTDVFGALESRRLVNEETWARLMFAQGDSGRGSLAVKAWTAFAQAPLLGQGLGATVDWGASNSSHNQFLNLAGDHGILGLLTFPALGVAIAYRNPSAVPFVVVLMLSGLFSHNLLENRALLLVTVLGAAHGFAVEPSPREAPADARPARADEAS
jgi:hypothetical protein